VSDDVAEQYKLGMDIAATYVELQEKEECKAQGHQFAHTDSRTKLDQITV